MRPESGVSIQNTLSCKFSDWPYSFSSLNGVLKPFLSSSYGQMPIFSTATPCGKTRIQCVYSECTFLQSFRLALLFFQASIVFQSHSKAVFMVKCPHFSRGHATTPCRVGRYVHPSVTFLNSEQFLPRGSNPSLEAQIPTSKLKSLPQSSNPSLKAQIPASKLKSQHPGPIPASRP